MAPLKAASKCVTRKRKTKEDSSEFVSDLKVCLICLSTNKKLYVLSSNNLDQCYTNLSSLDIDAHLQEYICMFCAVLLKKSWAFKEKCVISFGILNNLRKDKKLKLSSSDLPNDSTCNLSVKNFAPDTYDCNYNEEDLKIEGTPKCDEKIEDNPPLDIIDSKTDYIDDQNDVDDDFDDGIGSNDDPIKINDLVTKPEDTEVTEPVKDEDDITIEAIANKKRKKNLVKKPKINKAKVKKSNEINDKMNEYFTVTIFQTLDEKVKELEKRKEHANYLNAPLKCEMCFQGYLDNETYDLHMHKHTEKHGKFICAVCQYRCMSKERLRQHIYFRHSRKFSCNVCSFESHDKYRASLHMKFHEGKTYSCKYCDKVFNHMVNLHNHLRAKHPTDNVCSYCGYSFIGQHGLATHTSLTHKHHLRQIPENGPYCKECDVRFVSEDALQVHLNVSSKHGKGLENFKKRNYRQLHETIKGETPKVRKEKEIKKIVRKKGGIRVEKREIKLTKFETPVPCEKCAQPIQSASEYHYHFKKCHPGEKRTWYPAYTHPLLCELCGKMLRTNALKDHMLEHSNITFKCDICDKRFSKKSNMRLHKRGHVGERFPCSQCGKLFTHMGNRDRHVRYVHTESKDFKCDLCGKGFKNDGAKKLHINHVHLRKPYPKRHRNKEGQQDGGRRRQKETDIDQDVAFRDSEVWE